MPSDPWPVDAWATLPSFADPLAYERASVSVLFGNCTEPSNVKAGGGACPIRFQCAGCGFYRPDPSYLPALEEHIHSLKADRETAQAMGAADDVIANMSTEIDAFTRVVDTMRRRLAELEPEQRAEVEESSRILRRARAARRPPGSSPRPRRPDVPPRPTRSGARLKRPAPRTASASARSRTPAALQTLETTDAPITFTAVATAAGVSTWLVYSTESANTSTPLDTAKPTTAPPQRRRPLPNVPQHRTACAPTRPSPRSRSRRCAPNGTNSTSACACKLGAELKYRAGPT